MSPKRPAHQKHIPQRVCVGCREALAKRALLRVVRGANGVQIDLTGKSAGRGAYVHDTKACWEQALGGSLARALKTELTASERDALEAYIRKFDSEANDAPASSPHGGGTA